MKKLVVVIIGLACATLVSANLLSNPGFEEGDGQDGVTGSNGFAKGWAVDWWAYQDTEVQNWGNGHYSGSNAVAFRGWIDGGYGGFGQDVTVDLSNGNIFDFSIYGRAEADYGSTDSETWLKMEFWDSSGSTLYYAVTNDIYSAITGDPDNWNQYSFRYTNDNESVGMVKPMVGAGAFDNTSGSQGATWDDASFVQIPEPMTAGLLLLGIGGIYIFRRRK